MKSIGIIRRVDELGRVVIPIELRKTMDIEEGTPLEIFVRENEIVLKKYLTKKCECGQRLEEADQYCRKCGKKV